MSDLEQDLARLGPDEKRSMLRRLLLERTAPSKREYPLSSGQRSLWFLHKLSPESAAYNVSFAARVRSPLNLKALRESLQRLVDRHAGLRTTFRERNGEPVQVVHSRWELDFKEISASDWDEEELYDRVSAEAHRPFDLVRGPLFRGTVFSRSSQDQVLLFSVHHIIGDYWTVVILMSEVRRVYDARTNGEEIVLPPLPAEYPDFVRWQQNYLASPRGEQDWKYWRQQLKGDLPVLELPTDRSRPAVRSTKGAAVTFEVDRAVTESLKQWARAQGATLFMLLLAAFQVLLHRWSGQDDILVGAPYAGRSRSKFEGLVGYFVNTIVLRCDLSNDPTFSEFLSQVRRTVLDALEHQEFPFAALVERLQPVRDTSRSVITQVGFALEKSHRSEEQGTAALMMGRAESTLELGGMKLESFGFEHRASLTDLSLLMEESQDCLFGCIQYCTALFDASTVERFAGQYRLLLQAIASNPQRGIDSLLAAPDAERQEILRERKEDYDSRTAAALDERFADQARRIPDGVALVFKDQWLTYRELDRRAHRMALFLAQWGVSSEDRVAVFIDDGLEVAVAILGILKAGGAFALLDPAASDTELDSILDELRPRAVLTQSTLATRPPTRRRPSVCLDTQWSDIAAADEAEISPAASSSLACLLPSKAGAETVWVGLEHGELGRWLSRLSRDIEVSPADVLINHRSLSVDLAILDLLLAFTGGARLVLSGGPGVADPHETVPELDRQGATLVQAPPALLRQWMLAGWRCNACTRVLTSGEVIDRDLSSRLDEAGATLWRLFGRAETVLGPATLQQSNDTSPARRCSGRSLQVLDSELQLVPVGIVGRLFAASSSQARGYLDQPRLTAASFLPDPFSEAPGARLFETGERARLRSEGSLELLGRRGNQPTLRGFPLEPGRVEAVLRLHPAVHDAAVWVREDTGGAGSLVACIASKNGTEIPASQMQLFLKGRLPSYLYPSQWIRVSRLPLTPSGELDRGALTAEEIDSEPTAFRLRPRVDPQDHIDELSARTDLTKNEFLVWAGQRSYPDQPIYNIACFYAISGPIEWQHMQRAFQAFGNSCDAWRTVFEEVDGLPRRRVLPHMSFSLGYEDFSDQANPREAFWSWAKPRSRMMFDLSRCLVDSVLVKLSSREFYWYLNQHHIITDGWSTALILRQVSDLYQQSLEGRLESGTLALPAFADFAAAERERRGSSAYLDAKEYWKNKLAEGLEPIDFYGNSSSKRTTLVERMTYDLGRERSEQIRQIAATKDFSAATVHLSRFNIFAGLFFAYLYRISGNRTLSVATIFANRKSKKSKQTIGLLMQVAPLRVRLSSTETFQSLIGKVKTEMLETLRRQSYSVANPPERPVYDVLFNYETQTYPDFSGFPVRLERVYHGREIDSLAMLVRDYEGSGNFALDVDFHCDLFEPEQREATYRQFLRLLDAFLIDARQPLSDVDLLSPAERAQVVYELNRTAAPAPPAESVLELFESRADLAPHAPAVVFNGQPLSYGELNRQANQLAHHLIELGVGPEKPVGLCLDRSPQMIVGLLGILKAGAPYLPLDPAYPAQRLSLMVRTADVCLLVTETRLLDLIPHGATSTLCLDGDWEQVARHSGKNPPRRVSGENLAYVIFTSGSTGRPNGVQVPHRTLVNYTETAADLFDLKPGDRMLQFASISFDTAAEEIFPTLARGATLVLRSTRTIDAVPDFLARCDDMGVTVLDLPTAYWHELVSQLSDNREGLPASIRLVIIGGERALPERLRLWRQRVGDSVRLLNTYGPTEATVVATFADLSAKLSPATNGNGTVAPMQVPIGRPIRNVQTYILDRDLNPLPRGIRGELYLAGSGVARGYLHRPEMSAERFLPQPFGAPGTRLYKTGDLCRWLPSGDLQFEGRADHQFKLRGHRIELGEIEAALREHPEVREAIVLPREDSAGDRRLIAYLAMDASNSNGHPARDERLRQWEALYDDHYRQRAFTEDPTFNAVGWNSSYTGLPLPVEQMREAVGRTVERIRSLRPQRVLEIGCGTGLLLFPLASGCERYLGTDFSEEALRYVQGQVERLNLKNVTLAKRMADDFSEMEPASFDVVILNSVVQYFPSMDYLLRVLKGAVRVVAPGGFVFLGDLRNFSLLEAFHASVELHKAPASLNRAQISQRVQQHLEQEKELVIAPEFFSALPQELPELTGAEIRLKRGRFHNELTQFRYDVILHLKSDDVPANLETWLDWQENNLTVSVLKQRLASSKPSVLGIKRVPNARLVDALAAQRMLGSSDDSRTAEELRQALENHHRDDAIDPEDIRDLSDEVGYTAEFSWSKPSTDGGFDVVLRPGDANSMASGVSFRFAIEETPAGSLGNYVTTPLFSATAQRLVPEVRQLVAKKLPDYMVPAHFVTLAALPLLPSGKIDREALPEPDGNRPEVATNFVEPESPLEAELVRIWRDVLGVKKIGIHDNFFELGGDSILSIQVVARARQAGLQLTPQQLFQNQTIAELANVVGTGPSAREEQGPVTGVVPLTPIQCSFFEQRPTEPHHFNQAVLLEVRQHLDPIALQRALGRLIEHHDALRMRYRCRQGVWTQENADGQAGDEASVFRRFDLRKLPAAEQRASLESRCAELQRTLNLERGPLLRVALFQMDESAERLLIVVHHLVIDGISWRILIEDLLTGYQQASFGQEILLPPKTTSYQKWARRLETYAASTALDDEWDYWRAVVEGPTTPLPVDFPDGANDAGSADNFQLSLTSEETKALLRDVPVAYRTQINDVLLTSLLQAYRSWTGHRSIVLHLEGHGREELFAELDLSRTVGWFTSLFPLRLELPHEGGLAEDLKSVKEQLRRIPKRGIGYGVLRHLRRPGQGVHPLTSNAELSFNYLGQLDQILPESAPFGLAKESVGPMWSPLQVRPHLLDINGWIESGSLHLSWTFSRHLHRQETIARLAEMFLQRLRDLIAHCQLEDAGGSTPSDFPLAELDQARVDRLVGDDHRQIEDIYPLSPLQAGMLFHSRYSASSRAYFAQVCCTLGAADFDVSLFKRAWQQVLDRHTALRTSFVWDGLGEPLQRVHRDVEIPWDELDFRGRTPSEQEVRLSSYLKADRERGFDLKRPPLLRVGMIRLADDAWRMVWSHHHLLLDGWSMPLFVQEVLSFYEAGLRGVRVPADPVPPYRDYIAWLRSQDMAKAEVFWRENLRGFTTPTTLPGRRAPAGGLDEGQFAEQERHLSEETTRALQALARRHQITLNTLVQGAWAILLSRYSRTEDVMFGATFSGRSASVPHIESMLGLFINTLPVRVLVDREAPVLEWLKGLHRRQTELHEYEYSPLVKIQQWSELSRGTPLFETILVLENYPLDSLLQRGDQLTSLKVSDLQLSGQGSLPLTVLVHAASALSVRMRYYRSRFDDETMARLTQHLLNLLESISSADGDGGRIGHLRMLTEDERHQLLFGWNRRELPLAGGVCLQKLFEAQVERTPDAVALVSGDRRLTYGELDQRANRLALALRARGAGPEVPVGIFIERGLEMVVAVLGILKAGGVYLPIDTKSPKERLSFLIEDTRVPIILTRSSLVQDLPAHHAEVLLLDADAPGVQQEPAVANPGTAVENACYIIYTSGSTGVPKGVVVEHRQILNYMRAVIEACQIEPGTHFGMVQPLTVDSSQTVLFPSLCHGGCLHLISEEMSLDAHRLGEYFDCHGVDLLKIAPSHLAALQTGARPEQFMPRRRLIIGGEESHRDWVVDLMAIAGGCRIFNHYGPTEATVGMLTFAVNESFKRRGGSVVPIGEPLPNTKAYVLDERLEPVPSGVAGELHAGGAAVVRGYLRRPEITAAKFLPDPFAATPGGRIYKTGDLVRWDASGNIEFIGRTDDQVKIRGFRVEPGEVERLAAKHPSVRDVCVAAWGEHHGKRLVAYVVWQTGETPAPQEAGGSSPVQSLRSFLKAQLPDYMMPSAYIELDQLPRTRHGKVDRHGLPDPEGRTMELGAPYLAPRNALETFLAGLWAEELGVDKVGVHHNFFELGGDSIKATVLVNRLQQSLGEVLYVVALFEAQTVAELAEYLSQHHPEAVRRLVGEGAGLSIDRSSAPSEAIEQMECITQDSQEDIELRISELSSDEVRLELEKALAEDPEAFE